MGFFKNLFSKSDNKIDLTPEELVEAGACPNCWGQQVYEGHYVEYSKDLTKDNINKDKIHQKAFVSQFVETYITGIKLKREGDRLHCSNCNTTV